MQAQSVPAKTQSTSLDDRTVVVVCAADDRYSMPLAVVARSASDNLDPNWQLRLFVIDGGITDTNKAKIVNSLDSDRCKVEFVPKPDTWVAAIRDSLNYLNTATPAELQHITASAATYYRLFITELLPSTTERAIYLDCDLVVKDDLRKLWDADFKDAYVLAVQDLWVPYVSSINGVPYEELGIPGDSKYFNAGVLVINLQKWRSNSVTTKSIEYLKTHRQTIRAHDQDVLNGLFAGQWQELDSSWNLTPAIVDLFPSWRDSPFSEETYQRLLQSPSIIHFATNRKPWSSRHTLFKDAFFEYVDKTAWSGWRLTFWHRLKIAVNREYKKILNRFK